VTRDVRDLQSSLAGAPITRAVCNSCLGVRVDLTQEWLREASAGKSYTTHYCSDDFAFRALDPIVSPRPCPHCQGSPVVIPVDDATASLIETYLADKS
jgi:hypothetical protein